MKQVEKQKHFAAGCHLQRLPDKSKEPQWLNLRPPVKMKKSKSKGKNNL